MLPPAGADPKREANLPGVSGLIGAQRQAGEAATTAE
jgi:hypothetical protein